MFVHTDKSRFGMFHLVSAAPGTHEVRVEFEWDGLLSDPKKVQVREESRIKLFYRKEATIRSDD